MNPLSTTGSFALAMIFAVGFLFSSIGHADQYGRQYQYAPQFQAQYPQHYQVQPHAQYHQGYGAHPTGAPCYQPQPCAVAVPEITCAPHCPPRPTCVPAGADCGAPSLAIDICAVQPIGRGVFGIYSLTQRRYLITAVPFNQVNVALAQLRAEGYCQQIRRSF